MRLYIRPIAPTALKVLTFLAERGLEVETVDFGTLAPEDYGRISPLRTIPVLATDSGLAITESLTICQYLDEVSPGRPLFGEGSEERALVGWNALDLRPGPALGRWLSEVSPRPSMAPLHALAAQFGLRTA